MMRTAQQELPGLLGSSDSLADTQLSAYAPKAVAGTSLVARLLPSLRRSTLQCDSVTTNPTRMNATGNWNLAIVPYSC